MLETQGWIKYAPDLVTEWETCRDEGREVACYEELARRIPELPGNTEALAAELGKLMTAAPMRADFPYKEPSDPEGIRALRPKNRPQLCNTLTEEQWRDKLYGAWLGRISGCLLGKPVEGIRYANLQDILKTTGNYPMTRYITTDGFTEELKSRSAWPLDGSRCWADTLQGIEPADDDTNYPVLMLRLMQDYGWDFRPEDVMESWMNNGSFLQVATAERICYRNAAMGLLPPETATYKNPFREMVGARIRGDFFGYVTPGEPELAAELAWRDACLSHVKNGIYGEMYICAMISAAAVCDDIPTIIQAGLGQIPETSRHYEAMQKVLAWRKEGIDAEEAINRIHTLYAEDGWGWIGTMCNDMLVTTALLWGEGDFGKTLGLAVQGAYDTDCNGATAGSIMGIRCGKSGIDPYRIAPYRENLLTAIPGYGKVTVAKLVEDSLQVMAARKK